MAGNILNIIITRVQRQALDKRSKLLSISKGALMRQLIDDHIIGNQTIIKTELDKFKENLNEEFYYMNELIKQKHDER